MTGYKSEWTIVDQGFAKSRVPQLAVDFRLDSYTVFDGPDCAIVVVHRDDKVRKLIIKAGHTEMEVPPPPKPKPIGPCKLQGKEIGRVKCESCNGNAQVKVFDCPIHTVCAPGMSGLVFKLGGNDIDVKCCDLCSDKVYPEDAV